MSFFALVPVQGPLFFHALHFSPKRTSFLISMLTASSCSASLALAVWRRHISSSIALLAGLFALTVSFFWLGNADRWRDLVLSMVGIGAGVGLVVPCISALIGTLTPSGQKGKLLGALLTVNYVGQFLSPIWSQFLLQAHSNNDLFLFSSLIIGVFTASVVLITVFTLERASSES
ncbi:MAG: MFS transporter [Proteobacteria bacterium]|nr:MAG: MFS transporter [Pseudomonadota bacterium]